MSPLGGEWRAQAIFTRDELEMLISTKEVPWDRFAGQIGEQRRGKYGRGDREPLPDARQNVRT